MGSQDVLHCLFLAPSRAISIRLVSWKTVLMGFLDGLAVIFWNSVTGYWVLQEESVVSISCWMGLRLEEGVEVPEGALNESIGWHLVEAHFDENLSELCSDFQKWVQVATGGIATESIKILLLKLGLLPRSFLNHLCGESCLKLFLDWCVVLALRDLVRLV